MIQASGAETEVLGTTGLCEAALEEEEGGCGGGEQHPQRASFRLRRRMAGRLTSASACDLGAFMT